MRARSVSERSVSTYSSSSPVTSDGFEYEVNGDGTATITGYQGGLTSVSFPSIVGGHRVTSLWLSSVANRASITSVTVPEGVVNIYTRSFSGFEKLTSVSLPSTLQTIGDETFAGCAFTSIKLPSGLKKLGSRAFWSCPNLTSLTIPANLEPMETGTPVSEPDPDSIGEFSHNPVVYCEKFTGYKVENNCKNYKVADGALFSRDGSILYSYPFGRSIGGRYSVPQGVKTISREAFAGVSGLTSVSLPSSLLRICSYAFNETDLTSVSLPDSVIDLQSHAFDGCESLQSVRLSSGMRTIDDAAFYKCTRLATVTNTSQIERYQRIAFAGCSSLRSIAFGDSVKLIASDALDGCTSFVTPYPSYLVKLSSGNYVFIDEKVRVSGTQNYDYAKQVVTLVNQERAKSGLSPVTIDAELTQAAMRRAAETALDFNHTRPNGESCFTVSDKASAENIAAGTSTPTAVMGQWMNSAGHRANILGSGYSSIGVGCFKVGATTYWVQLFGTKSASGSVRGGSVEACVEMDVLYSVVPYEGSGFNLNEYQTDPEPLTPGESYELNVGILNPGWPGRYCPTDASSYSWKSSNTGIATVGADGVVRAGNKTGRVTITATSGGGYTWSKTFEVSRPSTGGGGSQQGGTGQQGGSQQGGSSQQGSGSQQGGSSQQGGGSQQGGSKPGSGQQGGSSNAGGSSGAGGSSQQGGSQHGGASQAQGTQTMYRLYNQWTGEHFYTASASERNSLKSVGWTDEGTGWVAPTSGDPVYRLYNPYVAGGDHHYTTSAHEYNALKGMGWRQEGVGWRSGGSVKVLRQYNPYAKTGTHNYTADSHERDVLVSLGWRDEGTGWYAVSTR